MAFLNRETLLDPDEAQSPAIVLEDHQQPSEGHWHSHRRAQLVHAAEGVLTVQSQAGRWVVPPQRAVWVPSGMLHAVSSRRPYRLMTLYVDPCWVDIFGECRVVIIDRLVEELLVAGASFGVSYPEGGPEERLMRVLMDRLPLFQVAPLHLPYPKSPALKRITAALSECPENNQTLQAWSAAEGLTTRTAARRFVAETGLTFGRWRQQLRLLAALERLGAGESVTEVAFAVGYQEVSSFIAAFKATLGLTPFRYFSRSNESK
jgi:AraC-like DNA-binding protein